jgi:prepilin-type N-terminal cleavage/methylation domain-containing protein
MRAAPLRTRPAPRTGLTLVEVLVALLILATGALATVGTQVAIARLRAGALARERTAANAASIIDSLRALPCAQLAPGTHATAGARFSWTPTTLGDLSALRLDVAPTQGAPWHAETLLPCV